MPTRGVRNSLRKCEKLHTAEEFKLLKEHGVAGKDSYFTVLAVKSGEAYAVDYPKIGVICSRRFHHSSVVRNRARRLITECFRLNKGGLAPCWILVIPRRVIIGRNLAEVTSHLMSVLKKLKCVTQEKIQESSEESL